MRKIIIFLIGLFLCMCSANAQTITGTIRSLNINTNAVSVSVKDVKDGTSVYSLNSKMPMTPASTLKVLTAAASVNQLGKDYNFSTKLYKDINNDLYLKLGADPFFKNSDLNKLFETAKAKNIIEPKTIYIDDSIVDNVEWGEGWQWDDDLNPLMPKFSAYNIDDNLVSIVITPTQNGAPPSIAVKPFYPITVMNMVLTNNKSGNNVNIERNNSIAPNIINVSGTVSKTYVAKIPVNNLQMYFNLRLSDALKQNKIEYYKKVEKSFLPKENVYLVEEIVHPIEDVLMSVLHDSNNCAAETLFKVAGGDYINNQGSISDSVSMLENFILNLGLNGDDIKIVDGSGVSKNNIMNSDFMTDFLVKMYNDENFKFLIDSMAVPGEGTLKNRMLYFKDNLKAKTGTLSDTSAITGFITTRRGKTYAFNIMIKDSKTSSGDKKNIEEQILRQIYMN